MRKWWASYLQNNQNLIALSMTVLAAVILVGVLFLPPHPTMLDQGEYDLLLPELGLNYTAQERNAEQPHYFFRGIETFTVERIPWAALFGIKSGYSMVYPVSAVSILCRLLGIDFSTRYLAALLGVLLLIGFYTSIKALYVWLRNGTILVGLSACVVLLCGKYVISFNSLYPESMFIVSLWLLIGAVLRTFALLKSGQTGFWRIVLPVIGAAVLFLTSVEQAAVLCPIVLTLCGYILYRCSRGCRRLFLCSVVMLGVLAYSSVALLVSHGVVFNRTNLYNAFFDGVLVYTREPEETLKDFGMDETLAQDAGRTYYEAAENFVVAPNSDLAESEIYSHLSYPKLLGWYLRHPPGAVYGIGKVLSECSEQWEGLFIFEGDTVENGIKVTRNDWWSVLRSFFRPTVQECFWLGLGVVLAGILLLFRREPLGWTLLCLPIMEGVLLFLSIFPGGCAGAGQRLLPPQYLWDSMLVLILGGAFCAGQRFINYLLHPAYGVRPAQVSEYPDENYCVTSLGLWERYLQPGLTTACQKIWKLVSQEKSYAVAVTTIATVIMIAVLFVPRIGAYNNGDFGRMMDAMQISFTPQDFYNPEEQYTTKVIEEYSFLEPYDWSRIRPSRTPLSQTYISAFMRILNALTGLRFSTAFVTVLYAVLLTLCYWQFAVSAYRRWGKGALAAAGGYVLIYYGSYNLGWLNSLYGEGIGFVSLMMVMASSLSLLECPRGKPGLRLVYLFVSMALFVGAKAQYVVCLPILALWAVSLVWYHLPPKVTTRLLFGAVCLAALAGVCRMGLNVYTENDKISSQDTLVQGLYNGILVVADDPVEALEELGLDSRLAADRGKNAYEDPSTYFCAPRTQLAQELIYSKVSSVDYLMWYLKHPGKLWIMLDAAAKASADPMPDYFLYVGDRVQDPARRSVNKLGIWAQLRSAVTPSHFLGYLLAFSGIFGYCLWQIYRLRGQQQKKLRLWLFIVFMLCGILQYPLTVIGNGFSDNIKQIYLFREIWDGTLLVVLLWLGNAVYRWVNRKQIQPLFRRKKGAAAKSVHSTNFL